MTFLHHIFINQNISCQRHPPQPMVTQWRSLRFPKLNEACTCVDKDDPDDDDVGGDDGDIVMMMM